MKQELELKMKAKENNIKKLSEEEKLRRLNEMKNDATKNDTIRISRMLNSNSNKNDESNNKNAVFLKDMRNEVYNTADISMKDRLDQNKHYTQRKSDLESENFLKK